MKSSFKLSVATVALTAFAVSAAPGKPMAAMRHVPPADKSWMMDAAQGGMAEVATGKLMAAHGQNEAVRTFGKRMVIDHSKANAKLMHIAAGQGVTLPKTMGAKNQRDYDKLVHLSGTARDRAYITHMVADHVADIGEFEKEAAHGTDVPVRDFAKATLPTLRTHLALAKIAAAKVGATTAKAPAGKAPAKM